MRLQLEMSSYVCVSCRCDYVKHIYLTGVGWEKEFRKHLDKIRDSPWFSNWQFQKCEVSLICFTYNHIRYYTSSNHVGTIPSWLWWVAPCVHNIDNCKSFRFNQGIILFYHTWMELDSLKQCLLVLAYYQNMK